MSIPPPTKTQPPLNDAHIDDLIYALGLYIDTVRDPCDTFYREQVLNHLRKALRNFKNG